MESGRWTSARDARTRSPLTRRTKNLVRAARTSWCAHGAHESRLARRAESPGARAKAPSRARQEGVRQGGPPPNACPTLPILGIGGTGLKRAARDGTALATPDRCAYVNLAVPSRTRPGTSEWWPRRVDLNIFRHCLFNHHIFRAFSISRTVNLSSPQDFNEKKI